MAGGVSYILAILLLRTFAPDIDFLVATLIVIAAAVIPVLAGEIFILRVHKRPRALLGPPAPPDNHRVLIKMAGYIAALAFAGGLYLFLPEYNRAYYAPFMAFAPLLAALLLVGGWIYIDYTDRRLPQPEDGLYHLGLLVCGRVHECDIKSAGTMARSVLLRVYFLPVMYVCMSQYIALLLADDTIASARSMSQIPADAVLPVAGLFSALLVAYMIFAAMDVLFATIGYLASFRPLDADIRSVEATFIGWVSCLVCYFPFWELIMVKAFAHEFYSNPAWYVWFADNTVLLGVWGALVILAMIAESSTTMCFGLRFSNLTYRGLLSSGPFRLTKHPQYIAKLLNRFLFFVPFLSLTGIAGATTQCAVFLLIVFIYYIRARTEENHLSRYPEYVEYAQWIDDNGLFRFVGKIHPALKFDAERARAGKLLPAL
jgi:isoprenylcysteine carboxyl methyltransferase (ICMT) family protein YpbQ